MAESFFFYDLETSGINPREQRIMQFAGQRTDLSLQPIGEPINSLIKLTEDTLPEPDAILVTNISPQQTIAEGITEVEFLKIFYNQIATEDTIFVGYNSVRFDDEFLRYLNYRNFYDPYEWHWQNGRSRWDLLDVVRMTRSLRPEGINWPINDKGQPTNKLELLTNANELEHQNAHDALSDVMATIAVAGLIRSHQPRLFEYLLKMRNKNSVEGLVKNGQPFVYSSGKYSNDTEKTTIAVYLTDNPKSGALVYDLRYDPSSWFNKTAEQLVEAWKWNPDNDQPRLPIKTLQYNRCPAVAPLTVLDEESKIRIKLDDATISTNLKKLHQNSNFKTTVLKALDMLNQQQQTVWDKEPKLVDAQLYDGFFDNKDKVSMLAVRSISTSEVGELLPKFIDNRLNELLPLYKVRNFRPQASDADFVKWEQYRTTKLLDGGDTSRVNLFYKRLGELASQPELTTNQQYILEELRLYAESILPLD